MTHAVPAAIPAVVAVAGWALPQDFVITGTRHAGASLRLIRSKHSSFSLFDRVDKNLRVLVDLNFTYSFDGVSTDR
jgi:hypothetical protein